MEPYEQLEKDFARWNGVENTVACSSGTAALHLAFETLEIPKGSEVIVPDFTMVACARAVVMAGYTPVFVDCGEDLNMNTALLEDAITEKTGAILAVHTYGRVCDMEEITHYTKKHDLFLIEDLAEAHGLAPSDHTDAACWSFYRNKIIAGEEGGLVAFDEAHQAGLAKSLRSLGFTDAHDYIHIPRGHNYRMANALAVPILQSLERYKENANSRRIVVRWYDNVCPKGWRMPDRFADWVYDLRIPGLTRQEQSKIVSALRREGIEARHAFKPMHCQPEFSSYRNIQAKNFSFAAVLSREVIYLPCHPYVNYNDVIKAMTIICRLA